MRRPDRPDPVLVLAAAFAALLTLAYLAGCGPGAATDARRVLVTVNQVQVAGMQTFLEADRIYQLKVATGPRTVEEREAELAAYRVKRGRAVSGFAALANVSHAAKAKVDAFEAGVVKHVDWGALVAGILSVARVLLDATKAIGIQIPGLSALVGGG